MDKETTIGVSVVLGIIGLFLIFCFIMGSYEIVPAGHRGISITLGKVDPNMRTEGLTLKKFWIEEVRMVPIRQITMNVKTSCFSSDLQAV